MGGSLFRRIVALATLFALVATAAPPHAAVGIAPQPRASDAAILPLLRQRIKHVFVIYQENRSFDSYFGTFPGADNLASAQAQRHGFKQYDPLGHQWVTPFHTTASDTSDPDHVRLTLLNKADGGRMDLYVATEEFSDLAQGESRADAQRIGLLTMAHEDCDTIPFLWMYAHHFALYDHFFQGMYGPSTPGNIDLIAAQTGQTQWARNPSEKFARDAQGPGEPVIDDLEPPWGPYPHNTPLPSDTQLNQTYATLFLTLSGVNARNAQRDASGVKRDAHAISKLAHPAVPWGWYQEGYSQTPHPSDAYVTHHNALQFFGYLRNNPYFWNRVHPLHALYPAITQGTLGDRSVVFVKGGYANPLGLKPADQSAYVQKNFLGDDDHPGYSDSQISEAFVAKTVNAIAHSRYWKSSVIFIFWDDSGGLYDHVPPPKFEVCPDNHPCGDGPRVPAIIISPYAKDHAIVTSPSDHASFAKFLSRLFALPALATLPDEAPYLPDGPRDTNPRLSDLISGFDVARLRGIKTPIPASAAIIPDAVVDALPANMSCSSLGIKPVTIPSLGIPKGFAPLPMLHP